MHENNQAPTMDTGAITGQVTIVQQPRNAPKPHGRGATGNSARNKRSTGVVNTNTTTQVSQTSLGIIRGVLMVYARMLRRGDAFG